MMGQVLAQLCLSPAHTATWLGIMLLALLTGLVSVTRAVSCSSWSFPSPHSELFSSWYRSHYASCTADLGLPWPHVGRLARVFWGGGRWLRRDARRHLWSGLGWESCLGFSPVPVVKVLQNLWGKCGETYCRYQGL